MNNRLIAALVIGLAGTAGAADVDFDKGADVKTALEKSSTLYPPPPPPPPGYAPYPGYGPYYPGQWNGDNWHGYPGPAPHHIRYSLDCRTFNFGPAAGPIASEVARFESVEYVQECYYMPDPPPPPPPGTVPPPHQKGMQCYERPADVFRGTAQLNLGARKLLPWESDSFEVCMEGPRMSIRQRAAAYHYDVRELGNYDVRYELTPTYKVPMAPDHNGLSVGAWSYANGKFTFKVSDQWAREYAGEKVAIKIELYKDGFLFFNTLKGDKEFTFDAAPGYEMTFAEGDLNKPAQPDPAPNYRGPKKYYLHWGFKRIGNISTGEFVKKDSTEKIEVK